MSKKTAPILVYHNPHFLSYRGDHDQIPPPTQPTASVNLPAGTPPDEALSAAYAHTQHGYSHASWFHDPVVVPHLRSTSVGDLLALPDGSLYAVESVGFKAYQPRAIRPTHKLAAAYRQLETALYAGNLRAMQEAAQESLLAMSHALSAAGHPAGETPVLWEKAQPGDLIRVAAREDQFIQLRVVARRLRPKWRARRLLAHIPHAQIWPDSPTTWAVVVPIDKEEAS